MAYNFGQFLSSKINNYLSNIPAGSGGYRIKDFIRQVGDNSYTDKEIEYQMDTPESENICYYLKFKIRKKMRDTVKNLTGEQNITIRLVHENSSDDDRQVIKTIIIPEAETAADQTDVTFDLVIAPNDNYNEIQFILNRVASYDDRAIILTVDKYAKIINIIPSLESSADFGTISKLKQIGIQGPVGLQMCIDGESIKIGRTGIYEINHGYTISFLGFIYYKENQNDDLKPFILDYQY